MILGFNSGWKIFLFSLQIVRRCNTERHQRGAVRTYSLVPVTAPCTASAGEETAVRDLLWTHCSDSAPM